MEKTPLRYLSSSDRQDHLHIRGENVTHAGFTFGDVGITSTYVEKTLSRLGHALYTKLDKLAFLVSYGVLLKAPDFSRA